MSGALKQVPSGLPTHLLDPAGALLCFREAGVAAAVAVPTYVRHKPGESTIVAYHFTAASGVPAMGYVHWCQRSDRADEVFAKALTFSAREGDLGPGLVRLDSHSVFYTFPNDARLRRLRWYTLPRKLKRSLAALAGAGDAVSGRSTVEILRYKPERRVVCRIDLRTRTGEERRLLLRYSTRREAKGLAANASWLLRSGVKIAEPVLQLEDDRVGIDEFIAGEQLRDVIQGGADLAPAMSQALVTFHQTAPPGWTEARTACGELTNALGGLSALQQWDDGLGLRARSLARMLERRLPDETPNPVLIHGDLHGKNMLVNDSEIWFVDLERTALGPAAIDLGCLLAHALGMEIRQPGTAREVLINAETAIDDYRSAMGGSAGVTDAELGWHTAIGLIDQALLVTRHLEADWRTKGEQLLERAECEIRGRSRV